MEPNTMILVGEAAKSWVELQWYQFYTSLLVGPILLGGLGYLAYYMIKKMFEDEF